MCASYGLGGGFGSFPDDLDPMSEPANHARVAEWMEQRSGTARITGKRAINLNPLIRVKPGDSERTVDLGWWWLWANDSGPVKFSAFNSRDDRLLRSWTRPFQQRALLPANWYIEKEGRFTLGDGELFGIAAVTSTVTRADGSSLLSYSMVTRDAVGVATDYWPRMPMILPRAFHDEWLDPARPGDQELVQRAQAASAGCAPKLRAERRVS